MQYAFNFIRNLALNLNQIKYCPEIDGNPEVQVFFIKKNFLRI